jgi:hypothetical protein
MGFSFFVPPTADDCPFFSKQRRDCVFFLVQFWANGNFLMFFALLFRRQGNTWYDFLFVPPQAVKFLSCSYIERILKLPLSYLIY